MTWLATSSVLNYLLRCNLPNKGVDLDGVDTIQLLERSLDLGLVGFDRDDEDQSVVLLNLLHCLGLEGRVGRAGKERYELADSVFNG
jgi:hypothetical protein